MATGQTTDFVLVLQRRVVLVNVVGISSEAGIHGGRKHWDQTLFVRQPVCYDKLPTLQFDETKLVTKLFLWGTEPGYLCRGIDQEFMNNLD